MLTRRLLPCVAMVSWLALATACCRASSPDESGIPLLPEAINSFGAAEHGGWLYVYGGHQGPEHQQTANNLSRRFVRCNLSDISDWESLPMDSPLQNVALVTWGDFLYRIGGLGIDKSTERKLDSTRDVMRFDPATKQWSPMPPLPAPRSSHDAIADEGKLYIVGGCHQHGVNVKDWHDSALVLDTNQGEKARWESLPIPSFRRRDLAVTTWQNCIWAIGGKDDNDVIHRTVFYFDPQRGYWSEGPEVPQRSDGLQGFGIAAWGLDSGLYVSGADGALYRLRNIYGQWEQVAELRVQRYCHRLLPQNDTTLLALAGYSVSYGPTRSIERIKVYNP